MDAHTHATHTHATHHGPALANAARATMEEAGEQWTDLRGQVFASLAQFAKPASAYDVAEAVSARLGRRIAANSIYRILDLFVAKNVARRVESRNAYLVNDHPGCAHDCIFLVCDACGEATHIDDDRLGTALRGAALGAGFAPTRPVIEVHGRCVGCGVA